MSGIILGGNVAQSLSGLNAIVNIQYRGKAKKIKTNKIIKDFMIAFDLFFLKLIT
jgi:hypothetical protein